MSEYIHPVVKSNTTSAVFIEKYKNLSIIVNEKVYKAEGSSNCKNALEG